MKKNSLMIVAGAFIAATSQAGLITAIPVGGTTTTFTATGLNSIMGSSIVNGFQITGQPDFRDGDFSYGVGGNGTWGPGFSWVGTFGAGTPFQIDLGGLYSSAGQFLNYSPGQTPRPMIAAIAADGATVLESYDLSVSAPVSTSGANSGAFRGISRGSSDIRFLRISGAFVVTHDTTVAGAATATVPEPSTFLLSGLPVTAILGVSLGRRRLRRSRRFRTAKSAGWTTALALLACGTGAAQGVSVFASGLQNPSKIILGPGGTLLVTEVGKKPNSGRVSLINLGGSRQFLLEGLPSGLSAPNDDEDGPDGLALSGRTLYIAIGEGDTFQKGPRPRTFLHNANGPSSPLFDSILKVTFSNDIDRMPVGFSMKTADHYTLMDGNPVTLSNGANDTATVELLAAIRPSLPDSALIYRNSHLYGLAQLPSQPDFLYVADAGMNTVVRVNLKTGSSKLLSRFPNTPNPTSVGPPTSEAVPNSVRAYGDVLLVSMLAGAPFVPGTARIMAVDPDSGDTTLFISNLSSAIDVLFRQKADGSAQFFTLEYSLALAAQAPGRLMVYDSPEGRVLADGLPAPTSMALDERTRNLFITSRSGGTVLRIDVGK